MSHPDLHNDVHTSSLECDTSQRPISNAIIKVLLVQQKYFHWHLLPHKHNRNSKKCSKSSALNCGDHSKFPRFSSWKKSKVLRRGWHKPERILEASALYAFLETKESKTMGKLCSSFTMCVLIVEVFKVRNHHSLPSIHHASGGMFEERTDKHLSLVSDTRSKVNILGNL